MPNFYQLLEALQLSLYKPAKWHLSKICEESQNAEYGAGRFELHGGEHTSVSGRLRVAKITPTKIGQFVVFWEKDADNQNQAFAYDEAPELLIVHVFHPTTEESGQFIFPKEVLRKYGVLSTATTTGKMAMRVYPEWDNPHSKQATATQKWQLPYFVNLGVLNEGEALKEEWKNLHIGLA